MSREASTIINQFPQPFASHCLHYYNQKELAAEGTSSDATARWDAKEIVSTVKTIDDLNVKMEGHESWADTLWKVSTIISFMLLAVTLALGFALAFPMGPLFLAISAVPATTAALSMWQWIGNQIGNHDGKDLANKVAQELLDTTGDQFDHWNAALVKA